MEVNLSSFKTGMCANCGASEGLHQYETMFCPKNGIEENRFNKLTGKYFPQQWEKTTFLDEGLKRLYDAAPLLYKACIAVIQEYDNSIGLMSEAMPTVRNAVKRAIE